jgi:uncharacterized protein
MAIAFLSVILVLVGLLGIVVPLLPGVLLAWAGVFLYALLTSFQNISAWTVIILLVLSVGTTVLDIFAPLVGAERFRASHAGIAGAMIGFAVGTLFLGPVGIIVGPFAGALMGELSTGREAHVAARSALGTLVGLLFSTLIKVVVVLVMLGFLLTAIF